MKFLLKELINPNTALLTDTQKTVLLITHISPSPEMAFSNTNTSENLVTARDSLIKLNSVSVGDNTLSLTSRGNDMLKYHNLVDDMGELTDDANVIMDASEEVSKSYNDQPVRETFDFLSSLF
jgi:hypothetical protein